MKLFKRINCLCLAFTFMLASIFSTLANAYAETDYSFGVSPMSERIVLEKGETYHSSFLITNPANNTINFTYKVFVEPFFVDENYNVTYEKDGTLNQMVDWITLSKTSGTIAPNEDQKISFDIKVPEDAPAGGQYAAIAVQSLNDEGTNDGNKMGISINQSIAIAHTIFAEIAGTTIREGEVTNAEVSGFLADGNIIGSSTIKNTGNVHGTVTSTLQVFPLFSNEEVYTNEEDPETRTVLPGRTLYSQTTWTNTPTMGIFNVVYTVEFNGVKTEVKKLVVKCPIWFVLILAFIVITLIVWIIMRARGRKKSGREAKSSEA